MSDAADFLLHLIRLFTNVFFYQTISTANRFPSQNTLGLVVIAIPVKPSMSVFAEENEVEKFRRAWIPRSMPPPTDRRENRPGKHVDVGW
jgi:hypothetical protein